MCGKTLVCPESGKYGFLCKCVYILEELNIDKEFFVSISADRKESCPVITFSEWGGLRYQEALEKAPEKIHKIFVDVMEGVDVNMLA
jgi:succinyl-CoA synthetase beta subunit